MNEIGLLKELIGVVLGSMDITNEKTFIVEGIPIANHVMLEEDTMLPVVVLYCEYMNKVLFKSEEKLFNINVLKTEASLFFVRLDTNSDNTISDTPLHIKTLLISDFFSRVVRPDNQTELSILIDKWRRVFGGKEDDIEVSIESEAISPLGHDDINSLMEIIVARNLLYSG